MPKKRLLMLIPLLLFCLRCFYTDTQKEWRAVQAALGGIVQALEDEDLELLARYVIHNESLVVIGPGTSQEYSGWNVFLPAMTEWLERIDDLEIFTHHKTIQNHESGKIVWLSLRADLTVETSDEPENKMHLRCTGILEKRMGQWRVVQAHLSTPRSDSNTGEENSLLTNVRRKIYE